MVNTVAAKLRGLLLGGSPDNKGTAASTAAGAV